MTHWASLVLHSVTKYWQSSTKRRGRLQSTQTQTRIRIHTDINIKELVQNSQGQFCQRRLYRDR